jgi:hypothetical protein
VIAVAAATTVVGIALIARGPVSIRTGGRAAVAPARPAVVRDDAATRAYRSATASAVTACVDEAGVLTLVDDARDPAPRIRATLLRRRADAAWREAQRASHLDPRGFAALSLSLGGLARSLDVTPRVGGRALSDPAFTDADRSCQPWDGG